MTCTFADGSKIEFRFDNIKDFDKNQGKGVVHELFKHGLKQKLSDCVAGATKNGISFAIQAKTMQKVWDGIKVGEMTMRKAAVPQVKLSDIRAKLDAMPEGKEKTQAVATAKMLGLIV